MGGPARTRRQIRRSCGTPSSVSRCSSASVALIPRTEATRLMTGGRAADTRKVGVSTKGSQRIMRFRLAVLSALVTCVVLVLSAPASASVKTLWHMTSLDGIATDVARMPLTVVADDDASDWQTVFPDCGE